MALHRDIYWVGKQWAVTGHGIQACNQKQRGQFDIAAAQIWEDGIQEAVRALDWVNQEDFGRAVDAARKHYPEPPRKTPPPAPPAPVSLAPPVLPTIHVAAAPEPQLSRLIAPPFDMRFEGLPARLWPVWRIRTRGDGSPSSQ
jgi:hypothetical protein